MSPLLCATICELSRLSRIQSSFGGTEIMKEIVGRGLDL
jgi:hypothetical protein